MGRPEEEAGRRGWGLGEPGNRAARGWCAGRGVLRSDRASKRGGGSERGGRRTHPARRDLAEARELSPLSHGEEQVKKRILM